MMMHICQDMYINKAVDRKTLLFLNNNCTVFFMQGNVINTFMIQEMYFHSILLHHGCQVTLFPHLDIILFHCMFLSMRSSLAEPQLLIFLLVNHQIRQRRGKKSIYIHVQTVPPNWWVPHCCMCSCHCWSHTVSSSSTQSDYRSFAYNVWNWPHLWTSRS
jgi:hypothetical protein